MGALIKFAKYYINYLRDMDNVFITVQLLFHHIGLWPRLRGSSVIPPIPLLQTWCPRFLLAVSFYFTLISAPTASYLRRNESIFQFLEPVSFAFMSSMIFIHVTSLLYRGERFERVFRTLHDMRACAARYPLLPKAVRTRAKLYTDLVLAFLLQTTCGAMGFLLVGFLMLLRARKFMFGSWYPYDASLSPYFELTTLVWVVYLTIGSAIMCIMNALLMYLFALAIAHTRLLRYTLENIKQLSVLTVEKRMTSNWSKKEDEDQTEHELLVTQLWGGPGGGTTRRGHIIEMQLHKEMERKINLCIRHHQIINRFMEDIGSAFGPILIHQLNCCLFPTAMSILIVVFTTQINFTTLMFVSLTLIGFGNLFLFCWLAQKVATETTLVGYSVYTCDWLEASMAFKRSMLVVMARCNQPLELILAGFIPLNVGLSLEMMKLTYSYYMSAVETMDMQRSAAVEG